ncbi:MAG TPA: hypothetical protein VF517_06120 [Thermoleophilaceae bacterium]
MPPQRRLVTWIYTGPAGHLWSAVADIVSAWVRWGWSDVRPRYSKR